MPEYRIGQAAELLGVSPDTIRRWADSGQVKVVRTKGGRRHVDGADLARFALEQARSAEPGPVRAQSARNRFPGIVTKVERDKLVAQVEVQSGPNRFVSLITREAADELALEAGMLADVVIKATNVGIELAARRD
ncbi:MAG: TOBE domain-containing protein [Acidimicrobiales bacterium]